MWTGPPESDGQESDETLAVPEDIIALDLLLNHAKCDRTLQGLIRLYMLQHLLIALRNLKIPSKNCHVKHSGKLAHRLTLWLEYACLD